MKKGKKENYLCLEWHVDDVPLGGNHHLHHDDEEQAQQLIHLQTKQQLEHFI